MPVPLSLLDLATVDDPADVRAGLEATVAMAQLAERAGYRRVWYAEHHNIPRIASSATSVLIAHVAAHTERIRVGAGGVMLPNHAPLTIAEQYGTLETLHPGRIDLGLGRAPGSDQNAMRALRRDATSADRFPQDVQELQGYLTGPSRIPGVEAIPGRGTNVPLYILGSSLFGARLAATLGLPYANASHFSPELLEEAVASYRHHFTPSEQLDRPYVMAGLNVITTETDAEAQEQLVAVSRLRAALLLTPGRSLSDAEADAVLQSRHGRQLQQMMRYAAVGTPGDVREYVEAFAKHADADELIVVHQGTALDVRLRSAQLLAEACEIAPA